MMIGTVPPSALQAAPVTYEARSEQRNTITAAISSGRASRPSGRPGAHAAQHLVPLSALLIREPTFSQPRVRRGRSRGHGVAPDRVAGVQVGDEPGQREHCRLRHGVVRHAGRRTLARRRRDVDDRAASVTQARQGGADRPHVAHDVQLPVLVPLLVRDVFEPRLAGHADVVDENVQTAERAAASPTARSGSAGVARSVLTCASSPISGAAPRPDVTTRASSATSSRAVSRPIPRVEPVTRHRGH